MVFAAPLFVLSQTRKFRSFYLANQQAFINIAFGISISYLGLGLLAKMVRRHAAAVVGGAATERRDCGCSFPRLIVPPHPPRPHPPSPFRPQNEVEELQGQLEGARAEVAAARARLADPSWLETFRSAARECGGGGVAGGWEALRGMDRGRAAPLLRWRAASHTVRPLSSPTHPCPAGASAPPAAVSGALLAAVDEAVRDERRARREAAEAAGVGKRGLLSRMGDRKSVV